MKSEMNKIKLKVNAIAAPFKSIQHDALVNLQHLFSSRSDAEEKAITTLSCALKSGQFCKCVKQCGMMPYQQNVRTICACFGLVRIFSTEKPHHIEQRKGGSKSPINLARAVTIMTGVGC